MKFLGLEVKRINAARPIVQRPGGFFGGSIKEAFTGAWQRNIEYTTESVLSNPTLFRCINLIASDIGKMGMHLSTVDDNGIWTETANHPVLKRPNSFQTRQQFIESWLHSKLTHGNTYVLKRRDSRGGVVGLYVLDPRRVIPLVTPEGEVYYQTNHDDLSRVGTEGLTIPASEMIHDRFNCFFHHLVGLSPVTAAGLSAHGSMEIASASTRFWTNGARPGGILSAPGAISEETATELKAYWDANFSGQNSGKVAVVGDGLSYMPMSQKATDSQLVEQLKYNAETICSVFGIPPHLVGVGTAPTYNNIAALSQQYYSQCLQPYANAIEDLLDEGLELADRTHVEFRLDDLIRLDEASLVITLKEAVGSGIMSPNEARRRLNYAPVVGGDTPYLQQQNYSIEALAERDSDKPFAKPSPASQEAPTEAKEEEDEEDTDDVEIEAEKALSTILKGLE